MNETLSFYGRTIEDKHTHYEVHGYIGPFNATIEIIGEVITEFEKKYKMQITKAGWIIVTTEFVCEGQLLPECRNPFRQPTHKKGIINSLDQIVLS